MGSIFGGPTVTKTPAPAALFPGVQNSYISALQNSGVGTSAFSTLNTAAQTGLPTDVGPAFDALKSSMKQTIDTGATNLREQFGGTGGLSGGSDLLKAGAMYEDQATKDMNAQLAQYTMSAQEAAANRQVQAATTGAQLMSEPALAFRSTGVVSQQPGLLGGLSSLFGTMFPNFDLGSIFGGGGGGTSGGMSLDEAILSGGL